MDCRQWETLLVARLAGDLPAGKRQRLDDHLKRCAACRGRQESWGATRGAAAALAEGVSSPDLTTRIAAAWKTEGVRPRPALPRLLPPALVAGTLAAGV